MQVYSNTPPPALSSSRTIAGFWRRLFAFALDALITSLPGFLLGLAFYGFLSVSAIYGLWTGFVLTVAYFAILTSSVAHGQTLGQRMMKIQVVDRSGQPISLEKSVLRSLILLAPLLLTSQVLPSSTPDPVKSIVDWLIFGSEAATIYFYIFNKSARQSLHDLAAGTYVVDVQPGGAVEAPPFWRKHWAILAAIAVAGALLVTGFGSAIQDNTPFPELTGVQQAVLASGKAQSVGAQVQKTWQNGHSRTGLVIGVVWRGTRSNAEQDATEIADIVLRNDSNAANRDYITIVFQNGFAVGFARFSNNRQVSHDPATWSQLAQNLGLH